MSLAFAESGPKEEKVQTAFQAFDIDKDGFISKTDLHHLMKSMVGDNVDDKRIDEMVASIVAEGDKDGDGKLSLLEFERTVSDLDLQKELTINPWKK